jgi:YesN/AraC family two-component response regulator
MKSAKALLSDKSIPVKRVSELSGFSSPDYFEKVFKKLTGATPARRRAGKLAGK